MLNKKQIAEIIAFDRAARLRGEYDPRRYGTLSDRALAYQSAHVRAADAYGGIPVTDAWTPYYCGKIVAAKDAEIAELREFSNDMRTWFRLYYSCGSHPESKWWRSCASCRRKRCPIHKWRKALEGEKK